MSGPLPEFYFLRADAALLVCERTSETETERAESVAATLEALNWHGRVVFVACAHCPWRAACPYS
jgi:hypothetical protein